MRRDPKETIARVVETYGLEGDLGRTAIKLGARRRTLERLMVEYPDLKEAIDAARTRLAIL